MSIRDDVLDTPILEVDLDYPQELDKKNKDLLFCVEHRISSDSELPKWMT